MSAFTPSDPEHLRGMNREGDVLLVEGNNRVPAVIKISPPSPPGRTPRCFVGPIEGAEEPNGEPHVLIEANIGEGVTSAPLSKIFPHQHAAVPPGRPVVRRPLHGVPLCHQPDRLRLTTPRTSSI